MLAIATHEPHFEILREDVMFKESANRGCFLCGETGHQASECKGKAQKASDDKKLEVVAETPFVLLHINVLREYLEMELSFHDPTLKWDLVFL
jgi:5'-3' exoribonuclease 2